MAEGDILAEDVFYMDPKFGFFGKVILNGSLSREQAKSNDNFVRYFWLGSLPF